MDAYNLIRKHMHVTPQSLQTSFLIAKFKKELDQYMGDLACFAYLDIDAEVLSHFNVTNLKDKHVIENMIHANQQTVMQFLKDKLEGTTISDCETFEAMF